MLGPRVFGPAELDAKGEVRSNYDVEVKTFEEMGLKADLLVRTRGVPVTRFPRAQSLSGCCCLPVFVGPPASRHLSAASMVRSLLHVPRVAPLCRVSFPSVAASRQVMVLRSRL